MFQLGTRALQIGCSEEKLHNFENRCLIKMLCLDVILALGMLTMAVMGNHTALLSKKVGIAFSVLGSVQLVTALVLGSCALRSTKERRDAEDAAGRFLCACACANKNEPQGRQNAHAHHI